MSDDTDFDSAFAEATDVEQDTQQTPASVDAGGDAGTPPADTKDPSEQAAAESATDSGEPADAESPEAKAAAAEVAAADKADPDSVAAAKIEPAAQQAAPQTTPQLDPKYLAQAIQEAQLLAEKNKPAPAATPAKPLVAEDFLTDDDKKAIETFKSEWPTEHTAINKMYDAKLKAELGNYKTQLIADLNVVLAPLYQSVGTVQANSHTGTIKAAHPDADDIAPAVVEWVKTQPSYAQVGMMDVLQKGNAAQVVELLSDYKKTLAPPGAAPVTPAPVVENKGTPPKKGVVDPAAVAALAAVPAAQRATPAARPSDNDFDAAFAEALAQA